MRKSKQNLFYKDRLSVGFTPGTSDRLHVKELCNISSIIEGVQSQVANDGLQPVIKSMHFYLRMFSETDQEYQEVLPVVIQTAGTITTTLDQDQVNPIIVLQNAIDDEFGYYPLTNEFIRAALDRRADPTTVLYSIHKKLTLPQHIIQLLNKEANTERLQDLSLAIIAYALGSTLVITELTVEVQYQLRTKGITIR